MPGLQHLPLVRVDTEEDRRKRGGARAPNVNYSTRGAELETQVDTALNSFNSQRPPAGINPELILRVNLTAAIDQDTWNANNLTIIGNNADGTWVLFASDQALTDFRNKLAAYKAGPPERQKGAPYNGLFSNIEVVSRLQPTDRIGRLLRASGITSPDQFEEGKTYTLDMELWPADRRTDSRTRLDSIRTYITSQGGRVTDDYISDALILARIKATAPLIRELLKLDPIATIDNPPHVSLQVSQQLEFSLQDLPTTPEPDLNAPGVCVVDSGIASTHPLLAPAVGEATVVSPTIQSAMDGHGHGTRVAGLALYGNVAQCIDQRQFVPKLRLFSARVLNDDNEFDDDKLITTQMRQAIEYFKNTYGCRVFNLSLGDDRLPFTDQKVSPWASILDHLARTLDVVIVVSAGNYTHEPDPTQPATGDLRGYPLYLLQPPARIIEPSTGAIVQTVGSLAESATLSAGSRANLQPIAQPGQPSPFTRSGPGICGSIKPEVCHYGGNYAADIQTSRLVTPAEMSVISLNKDYR